MSEVPLYRRFGIDAVVAAMLNLEALEDIQEICCR